MPMKIRQNVTNGFRSKANILLQGLQDAIPLAGEVVRDGIIQTTLVGIGDGDTSFKPYSKAYQQLIDAVGGKPNGGVDLRGIFLKQGYKGGKVRKFKNAQREAARQRRALAKGIGRVGYVQVTAGGKSFIVKTPPTRQRRGLIDPQSEMSADLIKITAQKTGFRLDYVPRQFDYMQKHNETRPWFSTNKTPIKAAFASVLASVFKALIRNFNA